jgi:hypothetical protein
MRRFFLIGCLVAVLVFLALPTDARAACLSSTREIKFPDGSAIMKAYSCSLNNTGEPVLKVEIDRLSEAVVGNLLEETRDKELERAFGTLRILRNSVFDQARYLFDNYGIKLVSATCLIFEIISPQKHGSYEHTDGGSSYDKHCKEKRVLWYLTYPERVHDGSIPIPYTWRPKFSNNTWSPEWHFFYNECAGGIKDLSSCVVLWRPASISDLKNYSKGVATELKLGAPLDAAHSRGAAQYDRYLSLVDDITHGSLPDDFLTLVVHNPFLCEQCGPLDDQMFVREAMLNAAFLTNLSTGKVVIDGLVEANDESEMLRVYTEAHAPTSNQKETITPVVLSPGETIVIPLRMNFVPSEGLKDLFGDLASARKTYQAIHNNQKEYLTDELCDNKLRARRDSFGQPTAPSPRVYSYGPAVTLKGVTISGTPVEFDKAPSNSFFVTAFATYGSCPYVYAFDDADKEWVRHGKTIDNASAPTKEMTQRLELGGLITKFTISEEELELTFVHRVRLELTLADGRRLTFMPRNRLRPEGPSHYDKIKYGAKHEYDFDVPDDIDRTSVRESTLAVTGYYLRYSDAASIADESSR